MKFSVNNRGKFIPVRPKNYRRIGLRAIEIAADPHVYLDKEEILDFSDQGRLIQKEIRNCINFEVKDGKEGMVGFHDHPDEMWIVEKHVELAKYCEKMGWLTIQGEAT